MDGIEDIEARFDERGNECFDCAARMLECFPGRVPMDPIVDSFIVRRVERAERPDRAECRLLGAEVRAADEDRLDAVTDPGA